jgi:hypothetical protein
VGPSVAAGPISFTCWIDINDTTTQHSVWVVTVSGGALAAVLYDPSAHVWQGTLVDSGSGFHTISGTSNPVIGTWVHLAYTYDGTTQRLFVNGVQENSSTPGTITGLTGTWNAFYSPGGFGNTNAIVQDVKSWSVALTAAEVVNEMRSRIARKRASLIVSLPMRTKVGGNFNESGQPTGAFTYDGAPVASDKQAPVQWGTGNPPLGFRLAASSATFTGAQVETAKVAAAASASAAQVETAKAAAAAQASGAQLETASAAAAATAQAKQVETASALSGVAALSGSQAETASMVAGLATLSGKQVETATALSGIASLLGAQAQTASATSGIATLKGAQVETAVFTVQGIGSFSANQVETASMSSGVATLQAAQVETAKASAASALRGAQVQSAKMVATSAFFAAQLESAVMVAAGGGGGGISAAQRNAQVRRPLFILARRGIRAR